MKRRRRKLVGKTDWFWKMEEPEEDSTKQDRQKSTKRKPRTKKEHTEGRESTIEAVMVVPHTQD